MIFSGRGGSRAGKPGAVVVPALLSVMMALLLSACGGGEENGGGRGGGGQEDQANGGGARQEEPITNVDEILSVSNKAELAGRRVRLDEVGAIEATDNGNALLVGPEGEQGIPVILKSKPDLGGSTTPEDDTDKTTPDIEAGQTVRVVGVVRVAPESYDEAVRKYGMRRKQFDFLEGQDAFILAGRVAPARE